MYGLIIKKLTTLILATSLLGPGFKANYDPAKFVLPKEAEVLVIVEGSADKTAVVTAYEKKDNKWTTVFATQGNIGHGGMNKNRREGDKSTPVGIWMMNTPFGQKPAQEGFPSNYIRVNDSAYVWSDDTNKLVHDPSGKIKGERIGTSGYAGYYDYAIDAGYNINNVKGKGTALFIHCQGSQPAPSAGCIKIPKENMIELMKLYGRHGDGKCFIAQGIAGEIDKLYDKYGTNNGLEAVY